MFGIPVQATVQRKPGTVTMGQTSVWTNHLTLQCWNTFGSVMEPISDTEATHAYSVAAGTNPGNVSLLFRVIADWPATTDTYPVQPGDRLVLPQGSYPIKGVKGYPGQHLEIVVEVPLTT